MEKCEFQDTLKRGTDVYDEHFPVLGHLTSIDRAEPSASDHHQLKDCRLQLRHENDPLLLTLDCNHCLKSFDSAEGFAAHLDSEHPEDTAISDRTDINDADSLISDDTPSISPDDDIQRNASSPSTSTPILSPSQFRWEDYYRVSVYCKICGQHLKDQKLYFDHLKDHYDSDPSKTWRECDCGRKVKSDGPFISHLCGSHEYPHHLYCTQMTNGSSCTFTASTKSNMTQHLRGVHGIDDGKKGGTRSKTKSKGNKHNKRKPRNMDVNSENMSGTRHHPVHDHHLFLVQRTDFNSIICDLCSKVFQGRSWHCTEGCDFDICTDCIDIKVDDLDESAENPRDIDFNDRISTESVEATESTNSKSRRKRRGRKKKQVDHQSESEKDRIRRKIRKMLEERAREKSFDYKSLYRRNTLRCDDCDLQIRSHPKFIEHMKAEHDELTPYHCHLCSNKYSNRVSLMDHYRKKKHEKQNSHELTENSTENVTESADVTQELNPALVPPTQESTTPSQYDDAQQQSPSINWEDYYTVSVDCKICGQHFDDRKLYFSHLKDHYANDPSKKWRECNCGRKWSCSRDFVQHLCGSHGYPHIFRCNQTKDGYACNSTSSSEGNMKQHLRTVHGIGSGGAKASNTESTENEQDENEINSVSIDSGKRSSSINWEDYYVVSVDCKICGEHFDDRQLYYDHLKDHYDSDPSKTWRQCDCGRKWKDCRTFGTHLCGSHGYPHIFQCNQSKDGSPCDFTSSNESNMKQHLRTVHAVGIGNGGTNLLSRIWERWTADEVQTLKRLKQMGQSNEEIGNELNRSVEGIRGKWKKLQKNDDRNEDDQNMEQKDEEKTNQSTTASKENEQDTDLEAPSSIPIEHQNDIIVNDEIDTNEDMEVQSDNRSAESVTIHDSVASSAFDVQRHSPSPRTSLPIPSPSKIMWEDYWRVSVDCKICGQHLVDRKLYWEHLKGHFESDPSKKWQECHCGHKSVRSEKFISHLCGSHGYPHYLHCNQMRGGSPCAFSASTTTNMRDHLRRVHRIGKAVAKRNKHNKCKRQNSDRLDRECIVISDVVGSVENEPDIDLNDATSTDSQSKEASVSVDIMESTNVEPRRRSGRKRKRTEHEFGSGKNQNRSKMQKLNSETGHCSVSTGITENEENSVSNNSKNAKADEVSSRIAERWTVEEVSSLHLKSLKQMRKTNDAIGNELNLSSVEGRKQWRNAQVMEEETEKKFNQWFNKLTKTLTVECSGDNVEIDDIDPNNFASADLGSDRDEVLPTECDGENPESSDSLFQHQVPSRIREKWTDDEVNTLKLLKQSGKSYEEIASELNRNVAGIERKWKKLRKNEDSHDDDHTMEQDNKGRINVPTETPTIECSNSVEVDNDIEQDIDLHDSKSAESELENDLQNVHHNNSTSTDSESTDAAAPMVPPSDDPEYKLECRPECESKSNAIDERNENHRNMGHEDVHEPTENPTTQNSKSGDDDLDEDHRNMEHENMKEAVPEVPVDEDDTGDDSECKLECEPECEFKSNRIENSNENPDANIQNTEHENIHKLKESATVHTIDQIVESHSNRISTTNANVESGNEDQNEENREMEHENIDERMERPTIDTIDLAAEENLLCDSELIQEADISENVNHHTNLEINENENVPLMTLTADNTENRSECQLECQSKSEIQDMKHQNSCKFMENPTIYVTDETVESFMKLIRETNQNAKPGDQGPIEENQDMEHENIGESVDNPVINTIDLTTGETMECDLNHTTNQKLNENANRNANMTAMNVTMVPMTRNNKENESKCESQDEESKEYVSVRLRYNARHKPLPCVHCDERFKTQRALIKHLKEEHNDHYPFRCPSCSKQYKTLNGLESHYHVAHQQPRRSRSDPCSDKDHVSDSEECSFRCLECNMSFFTKASIHSHIKNVHHDNRRWRCQLCHKQIVGMDEWIRHNQAHATEGHVLPHQQDVAGRDGMNFIATNTAPESWVARSPAEEQSVSSNSGRMGHNNDAEQVMSTTLAQIPALEHGIPLWHSNRSGSEDKLFVYCNHLKFGSESDICGIHYVRPIKGTPHMVQHKCRGFKGRKTKTITRTRNKIFERCPVCKGSKTCIRDATPQEQQEYLKYWHSCQSAKIQKPPCSPKSGGQQMLLPADATNTEDAVNSREDDSPQLPAMPSPGCSIVDMQVMQQSSISTNVPLPMPSPVRCSSDTEERKEAVYEHVDLNNSESSTSESGIVHHSHDHPLSLMHRVDCLSMICDLCFNVFEGQSWHCSGGCDFDICTNCIGVKKLDQSTKNEQNVDGESSVDLREDFRSFYTVNSNSLRCDECDKGFMTHMEFINHMRAEHNELSPYQCHLCTKKYRYRKGLMDHYKGTHQHRISHSLELTDSHLQASAPPPPEIAESRDERPIQRSVGKRKRMEQESESDSRRRKIRRLNDDAVINSEFGLECSSACGDDRIDREKFAGADPRPMSDSEDESECAGESDVVADENDKFGDKSVDQKDQTVDIMTSYNAKRGTLRCKLCNLGFQLHKEFIKHMKEEHDDLNPYRCHCGNAYKQRASLRNHVKWVHEKVIRFKCNICQMAFFKKSNHKKHMLTHGEERAFKCEYCGRGFKQKG